MYTEEEFIWHSRYAAISKGHLDRLDFDIEDLRKHFNDGGTLRDFPGMSYNEIQRLAEHKPDFREQIMGLLQNRAESYMDMAHQALVVQCQNTKADRARLNDIIDNCIKMAKRYDPKKWGDKVNVQQDTNLTVKDNLTPDVTEFLSQQGLEVDADE